MSYWLAPQRHCWYKCLMKDLAILIHLLLLCSRANNLYTSNPPVSSQNNDLVLQNIGTDIAFKHFCQLTWKQRDVCLSWWISWRHSAGSSASPNMIAPATTHKEIKNFSQGSVQIHVTYFAGYFTIFRTINAQNTSVIYSCSEYRQKQRLGPGKLILY
jgi:hypothetical protein